MGVDQDVNIRHRHTGLEFTDSSSAKTNAEVRSKSKIRLYQLAAISEQMKRRLG